MPVFFFVKRQVRLLKPNYLSGKIKQNFEITQWKWGKVYSSWASGLLLHLLGVCQLLSVVSGIVSLCQDFFPMTNLWQHVISIHVLISQDLAKILQMCFFLSGNVDQRNLLARWCLTFGVELHTSHLKRNEQLVGCVLCWDYCSIID
jgi:hypothetical protein